MVQILPREISSLPRARERNLHQTFVSNQRQT